MEFVPVSLIGGREYSERTQPRRTYVPRSGNQTAKRFEFYGNGVTFTVTFLALRTTTMSISVPAFWLAMMVM